MPSARSTKSAATHSPETSSSKRVLYCSAKELSTRSISSKATISSPHYATASTTSTTAYASSSLGWRQPHASTTPDSCVATTPSSPSWTTCIIQENTTNPRDPTADSSCSTCIWLSSRASSRVAATVPWTSSTPESRKRFRLAPASSRSELCATIYASA